MSDATYKYSAYGLTVRVPFRCSGFEQAGERAVPDLAVREGIVPRALPSPAIAGTSWEAESSRFLHRSGRRGGRFLVEAGEVTLERNPLADDGVLAAAFVGAVLPRAMAQRERLVLHASAVAIGSAAAVIAGASGAGKSTALAALLRMGCRMLADDVTVLAIDSEGRVDVLPGRREIRLPHESAAHLGVRCTNHSLGPQRSRKTTVPVPKQLGSGATRLDRIYLLEAGPDPDVGVSALSGSAKFDALLSCLYGPLFASQHSSAFPLCTSILQQADVFRISRPAERWSVERVCSAILDHSGRIGR
jgi:hypothetical protein